MRNGLKESVAGPHLLPALSPATPPEGRPAPMHPTPQSFKAGVERDGAASQVCVPYIESAEKLPSLKLPNKYMLSATTLFQQKKEETVIPAKYTPSRTDEPQALNNPDRVSSAMDLQALRLRQCVVFVDGLSSCSPNKAGAMLREDEEKEGGIEEDGMRRSASLLDVNISSPTGSSNPDDTSSKRQEPFSSFRYQSESMVAFNKQQQQQPQQQQQQQQQPLRRLLSSAMRAQTPLVRQNSALIPSETPSIAQLRRSRRLSVIALQKRKTKAAELGVLKETREDDPLIERVLARETQKRRVKKNAQSIYSVELPSFDETTGALGDEYVFPRSLLVEDAIRQVLEQERGDLKTKTNGIGILRFLKEFSESRQMIYIYFWYVVAHMRRVDAERMLIGRYANLERVFRSMFPHNKSELPPLSQLATTVAEMMRSLSEIRKRSSAISLSRPNSGVGGAHASLSRKASMSAMGGNFRASINFGYGDTGSQDNNARGSKSHHSLNESNSHMAFVSEISPVHDVSMILWYANAVDVFTVVHVEICELAEFAWNCFRRLAIFFGRAFERLADDKDEIFDAFTFVVPHVTYYALLHCFPNDVVAGLFNRDTRLNLYRIFHFWCSGLVPTYVRLNGWPKKLPYSQKKPITSPTKDNSKSSNRTVENNVETGMAGRGRQNLDVAGSEESGQNTTHPSRGGLQIMDNFLNQSTREELLQPLNDNSFEDVDVEVANGHHRLIIEFKKYIKHANYLVQELEQRTTGMHEETVEASPLPELPQVVERKSLKGKPLLLAAKGKLPPPSVALQTQNAPSKLRHGGGGGGGGGSVSAAPSAGTILPGRTTEKAPVTTATAAVAAVKSCNVLSDFPLEKAPAVVKQYVEHEAGVRLWMVPLPPLGSGKASVSPSPGASVLAAPCDGRSTKRNLRNIKMPLPLTSPLFLEFIRSRTSSNVVVAVDQPEAVASTEDDDAYHTQTDASSQLQIAGPCENHATHLGVGSQGGSPRALNFRQSTQKQINLMFIPLSDTQLRPLKFRKFTQDVKRRQKAIQRSQNLLSEREMRLRMEYNIDSRNGLQRVNRILQEPRLKESPATMGRKKDLRGLRVPIADHKGHMQKGTKV